MDKTYLVTHIADITGLPKAATGKPVDAVFLSITAFLGRGEETHLVGFGSFSVNERPALMGRNPRTGEAMEIPASKAPKFRSEMPSRHAGGRRYTAMPAPSNSGEAPPAVPRWVAVSHSSGWLCVDNLTNFYGDQWRHKVIPIPSNAIIGRHI